ncbi:MAG: SpoIIE family protein phosphatase [Chlorobi bacterium]|nr:SpoIIE family protein phosphatase [Chlorobiota bacterium]
MKTRLYIFTFISVALIIVVIGYIGMTMSLDYMQQKYIELQLDINKRQAQNMASFLENQLKNGATKKEVRENLQQALAGSDEDKGFLCMFDKYNAEMVCHPDKNKVGTKLPASLTFENEKTGDVEKTRNVILEGVEAGGLFHTPNKTEVAYMIPVKGTEWMISAHENIQTIKNEIMSQKKMFLTGFLIMAFITAVLATFMARLVGRRYEKTIEEQNIALENANEELKTVNNDLNNKNEEITFQKHIIEDQHEEVKKKNEQITEQNEQIKSSIQYARRIQEALLPPENLISEVLNDYFVYYKPRDIVSGDFYWFKKIKNTVIFAAADSTGHGVPGAFMSMLGIAFLNEIVTEDFYASDSCSASLILDGLRDKIKKTLRQTGQGEDQTSDGMDMSIILINTENLTMQYAGAYNPLYIVRNNKLTEVQADKMPVGVYVKDNQNFTNKRAQLQKNDILYMFSDGYYDQFGEETGRKFMKKRFREFLEEISVKSMKEQKEIVDKTFTEWKGTTDQSDDVLLAGIKI